MIIWEKEYCENGIESEGDTKISVLSVRDIFSDVNECLSTPCQNGATCEDQTNGYTCECAEGYEGPSCEQGQWTCLNGLVDNVLGMLVYW